MEGFRAKLDYLLKHNKIAYALFRSIGNVCFRFLGVIFQVDENTIIFSGHGRNYNDSPRAIYEYMIKQAEFDKFKFYWALEDPSSVDIPGNCKKIKVDTWEYFKITLQSHYWVTCVNIERGLHYKKKSNIYLNTWHGTPIKSIAGDNSRKNDNFSYIDLFCASGKFEEKIFKKVFSVPKEHLIFTGLPRNDELYNISKKKIDCLKKELSISDKKKVILYAPTWRDSLDGGRTYSVKPPINIEKWKKVLGEEYILLMRTHPYTNKILGIQFDDFVIDMTFYPKINDLFLISDILISDYSAAIFDYSILERPIICFTYDYDEYKSIRGFSLDVENELPGGLIKTEEEVLNIILNKDKKELIKEVKKFKNKYLEYGGNATKECVEALLKKGNYKWR